MIAAGGTAGHVVPALAVADALRAQGASVRFIGGDRAETTLVPEAGYELDQLDVRGFSRTDPVAAGKAGLKAVGATRRASKLLKQIAPDVVLGGGGYVAGVVGIAAVRRKIPLVLTEADSHLGMSNKYLAKYAKRVCLAFEMAEYAADDTYVVTGRPVPPPATDRAAARERFGVPEGEPLVLVFGGSLGARSINEAAITGLANRDFHVLHACGTRDEEALRPLVPAANYAMEPYIARFNEALLASDLVVARSGGSVFEIAAHGKPSILVPYPHAAGDHQRGNAMALVDLGAAVLVDDFDLSPERLRSRVETLLAAPDRLAAMGEAALGFSRPRAAEAIAAEVTSAAASR
ncbi:MAG: undecaprenyldiphospho-muramoylpentapeptide beta-N-acetylglucosaminyltransferase [Solirubrobacteraceae bacterium]|nr:undecaprenyldiphospho-muramoylpentapeptide beta-N-acetylglucosaminyltransferase [Solirubrobacteraceae bacterium]